MVQPSVPSETASPRGRGGRVVVQGLQSASMSCISVLIVGCVVTQYVLTPANCVPLGGTRTRSQSAERDAGDSVQRNRTLVFLSPPVINGDVNSYGGDVIEENSREVRETQHATCKITTEELVATAKATVTRVLKGLCNSREMEERFSHLETHLTKQLDVLKSLLLKMEDRVIDHDQGLKKGQRRIQSTLLRNCPGGVGVGTGVGVGVDLHTTSTSGTSLSTVSDTDVSLDVSRSSEETTPQIDASQGPRDAEFKKFNSTVHTESSPLSPGQVRTVFTYYWRVTSIEYKLTSWSHRRSLRSPSFYIAPEGYRMYIRIYPRQSGENVYVHVGLTRGEHDDKLSWPFKLKHRISIVDQSSDGAIEDIMSRIWDPTALCSGFNWQRPTNGDNYECVGLGFPHDVVRSRNYINRDNLVIKLIVYMD